MKQEEWDKQKVLELFKKYRFNRYIERFSLQGEIKEEKSQEKLFEVEVIDTEEKLQEVLTTIKKQNKLFYNLELVNKDEASFIIKKQAVGISFIDIEQNIVYYYNFENKIDTFIKFFKEIFEDKNIEICGYELSRDYILLKQIGIEANNFTFDVKIAAYLLSPTTSKYTLEGIAEQYLEIDIQAYLEERGLKPEKQQLNLFDDGKENNEYEQYKNSTYVYVIYKLYEVLTNKLEEYNSLELFNKLEMPLVKVLADMQYTGVYVDKNELISYGEVLKEQIESLTKEIYTLADVEFNINSPKQLGEVLFEKLKLPFAKKNKNGYSTDVDVLEKLKNEHPVIEKILDYRGMSKLYSTYVEGLIPYINESDNRIHSYFHQTVTATRKN